MHTYVDIDMDAGRGIDADTGIDIHMDTGRFIGTWVQVYV